MIFTKQTRAGEIIFCESWEPDGIPGSGTQEPLCSYRVVPSRNNEKTTGNSSALLFHLFFHQPQPNQHQPEKQAVPHSTEPFFFLTFFSGKSHSFLLLHYTHFYIIDIWSLRRYKTGRKKGWKLSFSFRYYIFWSEFRHVFCNIFSCFQKMRTSNLTRFFVIYFYVRTYYCCFETFWILFLPPIWHFQMQIVFQ